jgi:hypothetical protein
MPRRTREPNAPPEPDARAGHPSRAPEPEPDAGARAAAGRRGGPGGMEVGGHRGRRRRERLEVDRLEGEGRLEARAAVGPGQAVGVGGEGVPPATGRATSATGYGRRRCRAAIARAGSAAGSSAADGRDWAEPRTCAEGVTALRSGTAAACTDQLHVWPQIEPTSATQMELQPVVQQ